MVYLACVCCGTLLVNCGHTTINTTTVGIVACGNCYANGTFQEYVMRIYKLAKQSELDAKKAQLQAYKRQYHADQQMLSEVLINNNTYEFTKKFIDLKHNIETQDPRLSRKVDESIVRLHKATEENTKSLIIKETKFLAKLVGEQSSNIQMDQLQVKEIKEEFKNKIISMRTIEKLSNNSERTENIFDVNEINKFISLFDDKINKYNVKRQVYDRLNQETEKITCEEMVGYAREVSSVNNSLIKSQITVDQQLEE